MKAKAFHERTKIRLGNFRALRGELAIVYRACVAKQLDWQDGRAAVAILSAIGNVDRDVDLEARLAKLEAAAEAAGPDEPWPATTNGHSRHVPPH